MCVLDVMAHNTRYLTCVIRGKNLLNSVLIMLANVNVRSKEL